MSVTHKEYCIIYSDIQKIEHVRPAKTGPLQTDKEGFQFIPIPPVEPAPKTKVKTLLCILLIILLTLTCVGLIGVIWFGPRWPTYEISYTIQRYLLKIGVPLPAILVTLSVFVTLAIGICTYLCFGNP